MYLWLLLGGQGTQSGAYATEMETLKSAMGFPLALQSDLH